MGRSYDLRDLEYWDARIREKVEEFGLRCFPQEFEICDHHEMLAYMAYSGMPSHYPHWSYGKAYEKLKTLYDYGVRGLPYEMVINSNPTLAYLMRDNSLCLQILTIAHVYGHNDFFRNNFNFRTTRPEFTLSTFKAHADRVRAYMEDPSIGAQAVEAVLDAAHALALQCRRNLAVRKRTEEEIREDLRERSRPRTDPFRSIHKPPEFEEPDLRKVPPEPDEDLLLFLRDHNPYLAEWEKDLLTIVHEEAQYFIPQIETKIMNEGWATYWHKQILDSLELPQDLHLEYLVRHNQVVQPHPGGINPYHLGLAIWNDIRRRYDDPEFRREHGGRTGLEEMFATREADRDASFLRRHLTPELIRELDLFEYSPKGEDLVVSAVGNEEGWRQVKETLIRNVGMGTVPVIKVHDADFHGNRTLLLVHWHDGRDLLLEYAERTLEFVYRLWQREVVLETMIEGRRTHLIYNDRGFASRTLK
ncbi:MAG: stage V sporulation protein R [Candidatus Binatia bacterium]|nr:MAG: stage V sporulation protein R [Candidatus Binatia bacterium]